MVATGVGGSIAAAASEAVEREEEPKASLFAAVEVEVEVTEPVTIPTTLPLFLPAQIGEPDCPCIDWQLCAPILAHKEGDGEGAEHSSICEKAASVPRMLKNGCC